ncbi:MAG: glycosyltransferase, partial [Chloroflexota bacterium]
IRDDDAARGRSPLKMFESWACGAPFVSADVGDRRALLGAPPAGLLTAAGGAPELAAGLLQVLQQPGLAETLRRRGLARLPEFTWHRLARRLEEIYRRYA